MVFANLIEFSSTQEKYVCLSVFGDVEHPLLIPFYEWNRLVEKINQEHIELLSKKEKEIKK
jgi:hypothetical protein